MTLTRDTFSGDRELVRRLIAGDAGAAGEFVDRYGRLIYFVLQRDLGLPPDLADDLFQTVFERLWELNYRRIRLWRGDGRLSSYLAVLTRRLAVDHLRRQKARPELQAGRNPEPDAEPDFPSADPDAMELLLERERQAAVRQARESLPPRDQDLLGLRHDQDCNYQEIAARLGMTANHVGVALMRAEARLRKYLIDNYPALFAGYLEMRDDDR